MNQRRTVLIVDDATEDCERYRRYLLRDPEFDYTLIEAATGQDGLVQWQRHQPDAVLLDFRLPDLDGLAFLTQLQRHTQRSHLPVIVVTGQGNEAIAVQAMKMGAQDYLVKGQITPDSLQLAVNEVIEKVQLRTELYQRIERERLITEITQQIRRSLDLHTILQTTVDEVRRFLQSDRVFMYRFHADFSGVIVVESVGQGWPSALNAQVDDQYFMETCGEEYRSGRVQAIADIYTAALTDCHVELLERFQVRANLVVPILQEESLWGLLVTNQCSTPRAWQPLEIELLQQLATQVGIALQQAELYQQTQRDLIDREQAEVALRESEARFRQLAENIDAVFWIIDITTGQVLYVSSAYERLWGLNRQAVYNDRQNWLKLIHPDDRSRAEQAFLDYAAIGKFDHEYRIMLPDGRIRWVRDRCFPLQDDAGNVYRLTGIAEDVTHRKQAEQAAQEGKQILDALMDYIPQGITIADAPDVKIRRVSRYGEYLTGQSREVLENVSLEHHSQIWQIFRADGITPATSEELPLTRAVQQGEVVTNEEWVIQQNGGEKLHLLCNAGPIRDSDGRITGGVIAWNDISDRKSAELEQEQLLLLSRQHADRLRGLTLASLAINSTTSIEGVLNVITQQAYRIIGCHQAVTSMSLDQNWSQAITSIHLSNKYAQWQTYDEKPDGSGIYGLVCQLNRPIRLTQAELEAHPRWQAFGKAAGKHPPLRGWLAVPLMSRDGQNLGLIQLSDKYSGDFTDEDEAILVQLAQMASIAIENNRLYKAEQEARAAAERVNRIKDEFLAILSHELRSPLNPILGWTKLLQTGQVSAAQTTMALATIERNAKLQTQLIDDLLDMAKILRGKLSIEAAPVDLVFVIEAAIDTVKTSLAAKSIDLQFQILPPHPATAPTFLVSGDATRLQQVVWNLLSNAIKFTPPHGQIVIQLEPIQTQVHLTIRDTGKGISPNFLPYIFDSFRQEDASTTRQYGGLGLGLAIVRQLVEAHGGTVKASSAGEGLGAAFTVALPLLPDTSTVAASEGTTHQNLSLAGTRILVVDDEADARELFAVLLMQYGAEVVTVAAAHEAIATLKSFQPQVLLSDIGMPGEDGYWLLAQIRALPPEQGGQIPAIAITAYASQEDQCRVISSGFQAHIAKPIEPVQVVQSIVSLVQRIKEIS